MMNINQPQPIFNEVCDEWNLGFGLTPITAAQLLKQEFPDIPHWVCWNMGPDRAERALQVFVGEGFIKQGRIGPWCWERVPCSYGNVGYWSSSVKKTHIGPCWTGMLRITGANGEEFLMFSYLRVDMKMNGEYMVSTGDLQLLRRFADDVLKHVRPPRNRNIVNVSVIGSHDFQLKANEVEQVYLPDSLHQDIIS